MSQTVLGERLGVSFQQIQKYENGKNRVGAGNLVHIARILEIGIEQFFIGIPKIEVDYDDTPIVSLLSNRCSFQLLQAFSRIEDQGLKRSLVNLVERLANRIH